ncbi:MAG TPA: hypothetical protein ENK17_01825, partial [Anaerolineae bacterium]|nr:hypothetical protein [Anaerolineae bacterium]
LVGTATVLTTFLLAREVWGRRVAWTAATLLAAGHYHIHFSRLGSNQIADGFFVTLTGWLLLLALRTRRMYLFALTGAVMGLGWYGYFGARLVSILVAAYLTWRAATEYRFWRRQRHGIAVLALAALVVIAPLGLYYTAHPSDLLSRPRQVSIFSSGWLSREVEVTGRSAASLLLQQFWKSVSAFNYTLDPTFWYRSTIPLLDWVSGTLFIIGMVWALAHVRRPRHFWLLLWFWLALLTGWVLTENPPSSQRMTIVAPALAILAALGLGWLVELAGRLQPGVDWWMAVPGLLLLIAGLNLNYYFADFTPTRVYGNPTAEVGTELARYLNAHDDGAVVYFYGPPFMYWGHGTLLFMARGVTGFDVPPPGEPPAEGTPPPDTFLPHGVRFVFLPERAAEMEEVEERYPGGTVQRFYSDADGRLLFIIYSLAEE